MSERWSEKAFGGFGIVDAAHDEQTGESRGQLRIFEAEAGV